MSEENTETTNEIVATQEHPIISNEMKQALALAAKEQQSTEKSGIAYMSIKGKKFSIGENKLGLKTSAVILSNVYDNAYYDSAYDPDNIRPPACFAIGTNQDELMPHPDSPVKQHDTCKGCPQNEFGSSGKGKACKNGRRLLLASFDTKPNMDDLALLRLPTMSMKGFSSYVKSITARTSLPLWALVTELSIDDDSDYPKVNFAYQATVDDVHIAAIMEGQPSYLDIVSQPYNVDGYESPSSAPAGRSKMS